MPPTFQHFGRGFTAARRSLLPDWYVLLVRIAREKLSTGKPRCEDDQAAMRPVANVERDAADRAMLGRLNSGGKMYARQHASDGAAGEFDCGDVEQQRPA